MSDTPDTPAARLLSLERLAAIRDLQSVWQEYVANKPHRQAVNTPQLATTYAGELLAHIDAYQALVKKQLGFLIAYHVDKLDVEPAELLGLTHAQWKKHNADIRATARALGLTL